MEKQGILGPTTGRRPGDVTIPSWSGGDGLAIDVAITSPFSTGNIKLREPCEAYGAWRKHAKYDKGFVGVNYIFGVLVLEITGAVNAEGTQILKQIFRFAARRAGSHFSTYAGRAWARLSCNLQTSVAQAILNRASSREPALGDPDAEPDDFGGPIPSDMAFVDPQTEMTSPCRLNLWLLSL
jgi:hypothetical protein